MFVSLKPMLMMYEFLRLSLSMLQCSKYMSCKRELVQMKSPIAQRWNVKNASLESLNSRFLHEL